MLVLEEARERWVSACEAHAVLDASKPDQRQHSMTRMDAGADDMCANCGMYGPSSQS
eukprot:COSAG03_NODE_698_length_6210_cov_3.527901_2_plen_57_part_00